LHKELISRIYRGQKLDTKINNSIAKLANKLNNSQKKYRWLINSQTNFNILSHKRSANQNKNKIQINPNQNGYHQENKQQMLVRIQGKRHPYTLLVGM
jgi:hypothetical protein